MVLKKKLRLKSSVGRLIDGIRADVLFPQKPTLHFCPPERECPTCGSSLIIQKTREREVVTMDIGAFTAKETVTMCPHGHALLVFCTTTQPCPSKKHFWF